MPPHIEDQIPFKLIRKLVTDLRKRYFQLGEVNAPGVLLELEGLKDPDELFIGSLKYHDVSRYSYKYGGEVYNYSKPDGYIYSEEGDKYQAEFHLRLIDINHDTYDYLSLAHREISRFQHWEEHVDDSEVVGGLDWDTGVERAVEIANDFDLNHKERVWTEDVDVVM